MSAPPTPTSTRSPVVSFVMDLAERAMKTAAETALAVSGVSGVTDGSIWSVHWHEAAGVVLAATMTSVLWSLASVSVGDRGTASLVRR